jgi:hypothetical protein
MRINRQRKVVGTALVGVTLAAAVASGAAVAAGPGERMAGRAEGKVLSASLFGRQVDFGTSSAGSEWRDGRLAVSAEGVGLSALTEQTRSAAQLDAPGGGGRRCATPPPGLLTGPGAGLALPTVDVSAACGEASAAGDSDAYQAAGTGGGTSLGIALPAVLRDAVSTLRSGVDQAVLPLGLGALLAPGAGEPARTTAQRLDGVLGGLVPGIGVGSLLPTLTVGRVLEQLDKGELARITVGTSASRTQHDPAGYLSQATAHGGTIDLLPGLLGSAGGPLARISVADSDASVRIERGADRAVARVTDPVVRIESPVLGQGLVELAPGQRQSLLCEGPGSPLCTEIAVAPAQAPTTTADGRTSVSAATVSVRLLQASALAGLPGALPIPVAALAPASGVEVVFGAARADAGRGGAVAAAPAGGAETSRISAAGLDGGSPSPSTVADVRPAARSPEAAGTLPRTGGVPFAPTLVPLALLGSVGVGIGRRALLHRA